MQFACIFYSRSKQTNLHYGNMEYTETKNFVSIGKSPLQVSQNANKMLYFCMVLIIYWESSCRCKGNILNWLTCIASLLNCFLSLMPTPCIRAQSFAFSITLDSALCSIGNGTHEASLDCDIFKHNTEKFKQLETFKSLSSIKQCTPTVSMGQFQWHDYNFTPSNSKEEWKANTKNFVEKWFESSDWDWQS